MKKLNSNQEYLLDNINCYISSAKRYEESRHQLRNMTFSFCQKYKINITDFSSYTLLYLYHISGNEENFLKVLPNVLKKDLRTAL